MKRKSCTVVPAHQREFVPTTRHLPLVDLLVDTRTELLELVVRSGMKVLEAMMEEDRTALCGARYAHEPDRAASRAGSVASEVVLGGRKVAVRRPRVRADGHEVALPPCQVMAQTDPLNRRVVEQMLVGVTTRQYARSLEPIGDDLPSRGTSKSAVSRRFVVQTTAQLEKWRSRSLADLDVVALLIDGLHVGDHCLVAAMGIDATGQKHMLGLWDGATENTALCQSLLANLQSRGLPTDRSLLVLLDGSKALHKAVRQMFGEAALIQRCQVHKTRNVLDHLPDHQRASAQAILARAYGSADVTKARRLLQDLACRLEDDYPSAAESVREGLDETLTGAHAAPLGSATALADDDQRDREPDEPHASHQAQRQALAEWEDDRALGRRRHPGGRERFSSPQKMCRHAEAGRRAARSGSAVRPCPRRGERCIVWTVT